MAVDAVDAADDMVTVNSAGTIEELNSDGTADIVTDVMDLNATSGLGTTGAIDVTVATITADSAAGNIDVDSLATTTVIVSTLNTGTGAIQFDQTGGQILNVAQSATTDGDITVTNDNGALNITDVVAGTNGNINLTTTTGGSVFIDHADAAGNMVTVNSADAIEELNSDTTADIAADVLDLKRR